MVPLLPARTDASMKEYWRFYLTSVSIIILFGGLLAPILEVKMGLGGNSYNLSWLWILGIDSAALQVNLVIYPQNPFKVFIEGDKPDLWAAGTTYADFINNAHLPEQLAAVDPIVASFCGGAVGVLTTLLLVELNNSDMQARNRCIYCGVYLHKELLEL